MYWGKLQPFGSNQILAADPVTAYIRRFLVGPVGSEITCVIETPNGKTMFIQYTSATTSAEAFAAGMLASNWPNRGSSNPRSTTVVITGEDGGVMGA